MIDVRPMLAIIQRIRVERHKVRSIAGYEMKQRLYANALICLFCLTAQHETRDPEPEHDRTGKESACRHAIEAA